MAFGFDSFKRGGAFGEVAGANDDMVGWGGGGESGDCVEANAVVSACDV